MFSQNGRVLIANQKLEDGGFYGRVVVKGTKKALNSS